MKTIIKLGVLFVAITLIACHKDTTGEDPKPPVANFDGFEVVDGWITSPQWLADVVKQNARTGPTGEQYYPFIIYLLEYNGQKYICIVDFITSSMYYSRTFFSLSGEHIGELEEEPPYEDPDLDLWFELSEALSENGVELWCESISNKSASTRVDISTPVHTPNGTLLTQGFISDDTISPSEQATIERFFLQYPLMQRDCLLHPSHIIATHTLGTTPKVEHLGR